MFRRYLYDISEILVETGNVIVITFLNFENQNHRCRFKSAATYAAEMAALYPYSVPYTSYPDQEPYRNFIRKEQCSFAWDWFSEIFAFLKNAGDLLSFLREYGSQ